MKTIRQIADELGVSKTAVRKKLTAEVKTKFSETNGNTVYISEQGERLIKSSFSRQSENKVSANQTETVSELVSMLKTELEEKNKQIAHLQSELTEERRHGREQADKLALLADTAQKLHAGTIKQLDSGEMPPDERAVAIEADEANKKNGFIARFFGKGKNG